MPSKIKKARITSTARGYFHDLDPYTFHPTKAQAAAERSRLLKAVGAKSRSPRVSTFYTVLQDKRKNNPQKFGSVPQGPHTFPHHGIHGALAEARAQGKFDVFDPVIPTPSQFQQRIDLEVPVGHVKRHRADLASGIFKKRHARFKKLRALAARTEIEDIRLAHVINKLVQIDPHGSYAYKGKGAGKGALKGKGESANQPLAQQIDLPKNSGFSSLSSVQTRSKTLLAAAGKVGLK